jgi:hypothetical protein
MAIDTLTDILMVVIEVEVFIESGDDFWGEKVKKTISPLFFKDLNYLLRSSKNKSYFYS